MKKIRLLRPWMKFTPGDETEVTTKIAVWLVGKGTAEYVRPAKK